MTVATRHSPSVARTRRFLPEPFLHLGTDRIYNPLTHKTLETGAPLYAELRAVLDDGETPLAPAVADRLLTEGWLIGAEHGFDRRSLLRYVSLETHTICNQSCYFCPVSVSPRESYFMPTELFESLVAQLGAYRSTLEGVFLMSYNEPTVDKRFLAQCRALLAAGLPAAVNTNGSGLTAAKVDALVTAGPLRFLSVNLSTLDREKYARDRGADQLPAVLRNLDYAKNRPVADEMVIAVLGHGDAEHDRAFEEITARYGGSRFEVKRYEIMDRAGILQIGNSAARKRLGGCDNVGSRPLQHLHITPRGHCVLCCEDYDEHHVVGDLTRESVAEVLAGEKLALYRRWIYGVEEAPQSFMCRKCVFSLSR